MAKYNHHKSHKSPANLSVFLNSCKAIALPLLVVFSFILSSPTIHAQTKKTSYSKNFSMKGKILDMQNKPRLNTTFSVLGFEVIRQITTNDKGEYEVRFYEHTGDSLNSPERLAEGELFFVLGVDPNETKSVFLKKTKIKKVHQPEDMSKPPVVIKMDIKLEYEFE